MNTQKQTLSRCYVTLCFLIRSWVPTLGYAHEMTPPTACLAKAGVKYLLVNKTASFQFF